jgi:hypothetical protein
MAPKFKDLIRRTQAYWYIDELVEFGTGNIFFVLGIIFVMDSTIPSDSNLSRIFSFSRNAILIGGTVGIGLLTGLILALQARGHIFVDGQSFLLAGPGSFFIIMGSYLLISGCFTLGSHLKSNSQITEKQRD